MNISITLTADQRLVDLLTQLLEKESVPLVGATSTTKPKKEVQKEIAAITEVPAVPAGVHTLESVRAIAHTKKIEDVRNLLTEFGATGLTKLTVDQYDDFMIKLNKLS